MQHTQLLATNVMLSFNTAGLEDYVDNSMEMLVSGIVAIRIYSMIEYLNIDCNNLLQLKNCLVKVAS